MVYVTSWNYQVFTGMKVHLILTYKLPNTKCRNISTNGGHFFLSRVPTAVTFDKHLSLVVKCHAVGSLCL